MPSLNIPPSHDPLTFSDLAQAWTDLHWTSFTFCIDGPDDEDCLPQNDGSGTRWYRYLTGTIRQDGSRSIARVNRARIEASILDFLLDLRARDEMIPIDRRTVKEIEFLASRLMLGENGGRK